MSPDLGLPSPRGPAAALRVGITLPQFRLEPDAAMATARRAEAAGLDGVFVFDHLWPLGAPERPALHSLTLLGALAAETDRIVLGTLVARIGVLPDAVLVHAFETLHRMVGADRLVAALGTGDSANKAENLAYGVPFGPVDERVGRLRHCLTELRSRGITAWAGGNSRRVRAVAAAADAWNGWGRDAATFLDDGAEVAAGGVAITWGGQVLVGRDGDDAAAKLERHGTRPGLVHGTVEDLAAHLRALADGGAAWAVCAPIDVGADAAVVDLVAAARAAVATVA